MSLPVLRGPLDDYTDDRGVRHHHGGIPRAGACPRCRSHETLAKSHPMDFNDCLNCGHSWSSPSDAERWVRIDAQRQR